MFGEPSGIEACLLRKDGLFNGVVDDAVRRLVIAALGGKNECRELHAVSFVRYREDPM